MKESEKFLHPIMNRGKDRIDAFAFIYLCISSTNVDTADHWIYWYQRNPWKDGRWGKRLDSDIWRAEKLTNSEKLL